MVHYVEGLLSILFVLIWFLGLYVAAYIAYKIWEKFFGE